MKRLLLVVLAACGSKAKTPAPIASNQQLAMPAQTSCSDAGILLSQLFSDADIEQRGKDIAKQCGDRKWSRAMLDCIGSEPKQSLGTCFEKMTNDQQVAWAEMQNNWYGAQYNFNGMQVNGVQPDAAPVVDCNSAIGDAGRFPPVVGVADANRSLEISMRAYTLNQACAQWTYEQRSCLTDATTTEEIGPCLTDKDVPNRIAASDALVKRVVAKRAHAGDITCSAIVAVHYGDAAWKGKPATDKKVIADARDRMSKACSDDSWSEDLRACVAVDGGDGCWVAAGLAPLWGYPPGGGLPITNVPECDAYGVETAKLLVCQTAPQDTRDAFKQQFEQYAYAINRMPVQQRSQFVESCRQAMESLREYAMQFNCP